MVISLLFKNQRIGLNYEIYERKAQVGLIDHYRRLQMYRSKEKTFGRVVSFGTKI